MLVIGSHAMRYNGVNVNRLTRDIDFICTIDEYKTYSSIVPITNIILDTDKKKIIESNGLMLEFDIAQEGDTNWQLLDAFDAFTGLHYANIGLLYLLKISHRYKKDSPHFLKTMSDIWKLRANMYCDYQELEFEGDLLQWFKQREEETYNYSHPILKTDKENFFKDDEVPYIYDHDSIHIAIAYPNNPAYLLFKPDDEQVFCSRDMFEKLPLMDKIKSVYEEAAVLALERSIIPYGDGQDIDKVFKYALMKLCTSISSVNITTQYLHNVIL